ncbi:alpha-1,3-mannosyl-glycoprotein 4-beta-N-acetylglucosaminyltransferase A [Paramormyrops kingsleyae]|uniref:Alpha-1,3-mannosyl-glycoprotein 4-beta-N-acetylglucosaminyltransferase A n=1 Tax=Paramormyrops kingsleyae TaxID=1676925 RepID=A0A3B3SGR3_9TELE|nr:alpha-1,3-mannosyl-glycoprotein 4-beta-N-acetylglucosaminyltransferase A [Paramormyrops kingsleyae]XP_023689661.1 alpha-1,3-mannosyl-glycoprotein 4-beta-N-acetylglucosaminyltransferase A [Paramormyrops kingsleyae]XP_023689754.1 alpha-1,3-mannosyl-glycoprotein 4-beta-N-acetylglucosaminyltransferase A [Paramormyrops kingsleyae]XP_023689829.1 alpha-1,3-mannosyl-glycoprotein 4-beta-N-acetylglucosaminyltransferase A [Paramormyrops kingsleyae]
MRLRNGTVATAVIFLTSFLSLSWYTAWQNGKEKLIAYQREFHALKERLRVAEHRTLQRSTELNNILEQFRRAIAETNGSRDTLSNFSVETQKLLKELAHKKPLQVPNIYYHLPHLLNNEESLRPAVQVGQGRTGVSMVMGIPTVRRKVKSYLAETLHSLVDKLSAEERQDCVLVVFVGETDTDYVRSVVDDLEKEFSTEFSSGLLEVISPPASYYPDLNNLKETFGDSKERVRWRTKQNLDYSFLMMYAVSKGVYYVQLEDDIVAKPNYFATMKNFAVQLASEDWMILEFSQLGFIGKMFQAPDLNLIVEFIFMFYKEKPIDWLLDHILWVKVCNPEKDTKHCERQKSSLRIRFRPSLFQHVGLHSSLAGKIQKLTDKDFLKPLLHKIHVNPPAEVSTTLKVYQGHTLEKTYMGEDFFWAINPTAGDYVLFKFDRPVSIERYLFRSGNQEHPGDKIENTTVEILPFSDTGLQTKYKQTEDHFYRIGHFENGIAEASVDPTLNPVVALRLSVLQDSAVWAILSEIHIKKVAT